MVRLAIVAAAGVAVPAAGQELVIYSFSFVEVVAGTSTPVPVSNGVVEPGEAAQFRLTATVVPGVGSPATYQAPPPPGQGTIAGLGVIAFDFLGSPMAQGTWSHLRRLPGWAIGGSWPLPDGSGTLTNQAGQFVLPGATANSTNPLVDLWRMVWTPASYHERTVVFQSQGAQAAGPNHSSILIQYGVGPSNEPLYVGRFVDGQFGSVQVPIGIPSPGGLVVVGLALLGCRRKRAGAILFPCRASPTRFMPRQA